MWRIGLALMITGTGNVMADTPSLERQQTLKDMLKNDCGSCHGLTLKGGLGSALTPEVLAGKNTDLLVNTVLQGKKGTAMPAWKKIISNKEAFWLIKYLKNNY